MCRFMASPFHCIACSLDRDEPFKLTGKPLNDKNNQIAQHFNGKSHAKAMRRVGATLLSEDNLRRFLGDMLGQALHDGDVPTQALKKYIALHDGDVQWAMQFFAPPPPPMPEGECWRSMPSRRHRDVKVTRVIVSPFHATCEGGKGLIVENDIDRGWCGKGWAKMLCCWDDVTQKSACERSDCKYNHVSALLAEEMPWDESFDTQALFILLPCNMAGMPGGCKFHRDFNCKGWNIPRFELVEPHQLVVDESLPTCCPSKEDELIPLHIAGKWVLQKNCYNECVIDSIQRYLDGEDKDETDEGV